MKIIAFDFDGTIADSFQNAVNAFNKFSTKYSYKKLDDEAITFWKTNGVGAISKKLVGADRVSEFILDIKTEMLAHADDSIPYEGIIQMLRDLVHPDITIGIVSSNSEEIIKSFLKKNKISDLISFVETEKEMSSKAKILSSLIEKFEINPKDMYYIGDEPNDIIAAKSAGANSIAVAWGTTYPEILEKYGPDLMLKTPNPEIIMSFLH